MSEFDEEVLDGVDVIPGSLCMSCGESGETRLLIHKIPYFRELIIASFCCEECGYTNNEVTFGGEIQVQGCLYELECSDAKDLDRQLIKSDSATIRIPHLEFEIPPQTQKGEISTIEGFLMNAAKNLAMYQAERVEQMPEIGHKVATIISSLSRMATGGELPFKIVVDDPAGNSFVENPNAPAKDIQMRTSYYRRSAEQDVSLGLQPETSSIKEQVTDADFKRLAEGGFGKTDDEIGSIVLNSSTDSTDSTEDKIFRFSQVCPSCALEGECLNAVTAIPHFKEVIIMAFNCSFCGLRNNEVKGGGAVPDCGSQVSLRVDGFEDLKRDVLKSDSAMVLIPELDLELQHGTLGGVYTTVEGLIKKILNSLTENNPFAVGDSTTLHHSNQKSVSETKDKFSLFLSRLEALITGESFPFSLVLRDPLGNSFVSAQLGSFVPPEMDPNLTFTDFQRSWEENEEFGLNDINTKDFETGVDHNMPIFADRLTHVVVKGPDHPTPFAKGCADDTTPSGVFYGGEVLDEDGTVGCSNSSDETQCCELQLPGDDDEYKPVFKAEKQVDMRTMLLNNVSKTNDVDATFSTFSAKRHFDDDSEFKFDPREEFSGPRDGYVFRLGSQGLGYYEDKPRL